MNPTLPVNYLIRPNKNVERKLLFNHVANLIGLETISKYRYIGFGSVWFADFILSHKLLGISDMVSIEHDEKKYNRAKYNRPFACVKVELGESTSVLRVLFDGSAQKPNIAWLDYECPPNEMVLDDIELFVSRAPNGSVLIVTVKADHRILGHDPKKREHNIRHLFRDLVPSALPADWDNRQGFPGLLGQILINHARHTVHMSGRDERFHPIANICYQDGAAMITIGGIIRDIALSSNYPWGTSEQQYLLRVPALTAREKLALDQLLPCTASIPEGEMQEKIGFSLQSEEFESYRQHYQLYPVFHEIAF